MNLHFFKEINIIIKNNKNRPINHNKQDYKANTDLFIIKTIAEIACSYQMYDMTLQN